MIWLFLILTVLAVLAVLLPLARRPRVLAGGEAEVYRDQLDEIERDRARGAIGAEEAEAARVEVARRLLGTAGEPSRAPAGSNLRRRIVAVVALALLPLAAGAIYLGLGRPDLPDRPLAARENTGPTLPELVLKVEAELKQRPDDGRGWDVLAPVYLRMGQGEKAANAYANAVRLLGSTAEREAGWGEALALAANGKVTPEAMAAFERALALDPKHARSLFYVGLGAEQAGDPARASTTWRLMLADAPENAPYAAAVREALSRLALGEDGQMPAIDPAALENVSPEQRVATIRGMVEGLAARLKDDPKDIGGQLRLIRAWTMLGERDQAKAAGDAARAAFSGDDAAQRRISDLMLALELEDKPA